VVAGIGVTFVDHWLSCVAYVVPTAFRLVTDRRIERTIGGN